MRIDPEQTRRLLGKRIRSLRTHRGFTQQELGEKAGVSYKFLGEVERARHNPSFQVLMNIANALDIEPVEILRFKHETQTREQAIQAITEILPEMSDEAIQKLLLILQTLYP